MRDVLFLAHRLPWPPDRGDKIRSYHLLRHIAGLARVHLIAFAEDAIEESSAETLRPMLASLYIERRSHSRATGVARALLSGRAASVALFDSPHMRRAVARVVARHQPGVIFAFSGQMAQFVPAQRSARFVMDFVDVDSEKFGAYSRRGPLPLRWLYAREHRLLGKFERSVARSADHALFVSEAEAGLFRRLSGLDSSKVSALENGVDLDHLRPDADFTRLSDEQRGTGPLIVFTGQMDYLPNVEAVCGFAAETLPKLLALRPDARFAIVGRNPVPAVSALASRERVIVTGAVPDTRPWIAAADIVVAPLGIARGIQNKVLEAMAMARPVVASPAAAEGIDAENGRDLVVAEGPAMAQAIEDLLDDPATAATIGHNARTLMERRYSWNERLKPLAGLLAS